LTCVNQKLAGITNVKAQYIQLSFRWQPTACVENSPLAVFVGKPNSGFSLHYISLTGYDCSKTSGSLHKLVLREQKKTATEVMA
jgi:hypothetical protein